MPCLWFGLPRRDARHPAGQLEPALTDHTKIATQLVALRLGHVTASNTHHGSPLSGLDNKTEVGRRYHAVLQRRAKAQHLKRDKSIPISATAYEPLPSIWEGDDAGLIERMLDFYPRRRPKKILDATVNRGRFWKGSTRPVIGMDIDPKFKPDIVGDNTAMPFGPDEFDVIVYDPPHIPNQGLDKKKDFNDRFGLVVKSPKENGYTFSHTFPPFCREAYRVLIPEGILLCKIADYVHHHRYQWAHIDLVVAARKAGFTACDCIVKARKAPIIDPKWKTAHHSRRQHCYWLVFRKSAKCE